MANVVTVHVRLFMGPGPTKAGRWPGISHAEIVRVLLEPNGGYTNYEPLHLEYVADVHALDIRYGAKGTPSNGPEELWKLREEAQLAAIWIRLDDDGSDEDLIQSFDDRGESEWRVCRYEEKREPSWDTCLDEDYRKSQVDFFKRSTNVGGA